MPPTAHSEKRQLWERPGQQDEAWRAGAGESRCPRAALSCLGRGKPPSTTRVKVNSLSHLQLCDPMDCSSTGSSVHGIFPGTSTGVFAISFSRGSSQPRDRTLVSPTVGRCFLACEPPGKSLPAPPRPGSKPKHPSDSCQCLLDSPLNGSQAGLLSGALPPTGSCREGARACATPHGAPGGVGGEGGGGPPCSSLVRRTCGHTQAQEDHGLFPGAPGQGSYLLPGQEARPQQELCRPANAPSAPRSWPRGNIHPASPPPSNVQPSGLKSRPRLSSGPSERAHAGSSFRLSSTAHLLSEPQDPHVPGSPGLAKPPNSAPGLRPSPSQTRPWTPTDSRHTP